jgi:hypothetical protein
MNHDNLTLKYKPIQTSRVLSEGAKGTELSVVKWKQYQQNENVFYPEITNCPQPQPSTTNVKPRMQGNDGSFSHTLDAFTCYISV